MAERFEAEGSKNWEKPWDHLDLQVAAHIDYYVVREAGSNESIARIIVMARFG
jgi:hypothetical protein